MKFQREKCLQAVEILKEEGNIDLWITYGQESDMNHNSIIPLLSEGSLNGCVAISKAGHIAAIGGHFDAPAMEKSGIYDTVIEIEFGTTFETALRKLLDMVQPKTIALNYSREIPAMDEIGVGQVRNLTKMFKAWNPDVEIVSASEAMRKLRGRKSDVEVENIREACRITKCVLDDMKDFIKVGVSEKEIYAEYIRLSNEKYNTKGYTAVFVGPNTVIGHTGPGDIVAEPGWLVTLDAGHTYNGYNSDLQRCYYLGKPGETEVPEKLKTIFGQVQHAIDEAVNTMKPGTPAYKVDEVSKANIYKCGFEPNMAGFGHQVGLCTHDGGTIIGPESPRYGKAVYYPLEAGNVFTLDQGYRGPEGKMGQEDVGCIREDHVEWLSERQKEIFFIPYQG